MTAWRALTLKQPWPFAIVYAGKNVENRTWPVPPKLLERECLSCEVGTHEDLQDSGYCNRCDESFVEPLRVMIHAGKQWDKNAGPIAVKNFGNMRGSAWIGRGNVSVYCGDDGVVGSVWSNGLVEHSWTDPQPFSAVVAVGTITGQHQVIPMVSFNDTETPHDFVCPGSIRKVDNSIEYRCSPWANKPSRDKPMWHWELADVRPLTEPVPTKGRPGLWIPDTELVEAVEAQI